MDAGKPRIEDSGKKTTRNEIPIVEEKKNRNFDVMRSSGSVSKKPNNQGGGEFAKSPSIDKLKIEDLAKIDLSIIDKLKIEDLAKIDLSIINKLKIEDLAKIVLPKDVPCFTYNIQKNRFKNEFNNQNTSWFMRLAQGTLKESYKYETYRDNPDQYKNLLKTYMSLKLFENLKKMNLNKKDLDIFIKKAEKDRNILLAYNTRKTEERLKQGEGQIRTGSLHQKEGLKIQHESPRSSLLFSDNEAKKLIAHEIAITRAYYDIWQKEGMQRPDTEAFRMHYARADKVLRMNLNDMHAVHLENICQMNESFKEIAKENPEQLRSALKDAIVKARTLNDWATNFTARFDLSEYWVQNGMGRLGINQRNFDESYHKFLANPHITEETFIGQAVSDIADNYQSDKIVQHYEEFMRANTSLEYIHNQLKAGIPASSIPKHICGRKVVEVSGEGNDCLPRALLRGAHPRWQKPSSLETSVGNAKKHVIKELKDLKRRGEAVYDTENRNVRREDQLNLGGDAGQILIKYLRSQPTNSPFLDPERPILTYQYSGGKIQCFEYTSGSSGKRPYAVLRDHYNLRSGHYWAIEDKEQ